ncbi:MAG: hypothetical protein Q6L68_02960 [Thermostichus sp. DG02_5_bins_236]
MDAIQSAGVKPSWTAEIDFWCAGTQKWLASGLGLAVLVVSQQVLRELNETLINWAAPFGWQVEKLERNAFFAVGTLLFQPDSV